jgi:hypothetical protein
VNRKAKICLDGWGGISNHQVLVIGETKDRYRVKLLEDTRMPGNRLKLAGEVVLVPKYAVRFNTKQPKQGELF